MEQIERAPLVAVVEVVALLDAAGAVDTPFPPDVDVIVVTGAETDAEVRLVGGGTMVTLLELALALVIEEMLTLVVVAVTVGVVTVVVRDSVDAAVVVSVIDSAELLDKEDGLGLEVVNVSERGGEGVTMGIVAVTVTVVPPTRVVVKVRTSVVNVASVDVSIEDPGKVEVGPSGLPFAARMKMKAAKSRTA